MTTMMSNHFRLGRRSHNRWINILMGHMTCLCSPYSIITWLVACVDVVKFFNYILFIYLNWRLYFFYLCKMSLIMILFICLFFCSGVEIQSV